MKYSYTKTYHCDSSKFPSWHDWHRHIGLLRWEDYTWIDGTLGRNQSQRRPAHGYDYMGNPTTVFYFRRLEDLVQFKLARG